MVIMLDTNAYDAVAADETLRELVRQRQAAGLIQVLSTHIEEVSGDIPAAHRQGQGAPSPASGSGRGYLL